MFLVCCSAYHGPGLRLKPDAVFADPPEIGSEPGSLEPLARPVLLDRLALTFGLGVREACVGRVADIVQHSGVIIEHVASHGRVENALALGVNFLDIFRRNSAHDYSVIPVSFRKTHDSVLADTDLVD